MRLAPTWGAHGETGASNVVSECAGASRYDVSPARDVDSPRRCSRAIDRSGARASCTEGGYVANAVTLDGRPAFCLFDVELRL